MGESSRDANETLRTLGKYQLIEKVGEGHLGPVFRGFDKDLDKPVVIRILCENIKWDAKIELLFSQVCSAVADLKHPNIVPILDVGKEEEIRYLVMESLGNGSLEAVLANKPDMSIEAKLSIMIQMAEGLSYAHKKTILHRDLGPKKIHMTPDGIVKIRDFAFTQILMRHHPRPAVRSGEPVYLSPEQIRNEHTDERSDIFSAGTVFYELLTYVHPFYDLDANKALDHVVRDEPIPTFEQFPDVPPGFWPILKTCLARDPEDRYKSMDKLLIALKDLQKSLADDNQLMLAELYASENALRKAAAQPNASESTVMLLEDIRKISRGDKKPDCVTLDRLMTSLIEQAPIIQAAAEIPDAVDVLPDTETLRSEVAVQLTSTQEATLPEEPVEEPNKEPIEEPIAKPIEEPVEETEEPVEEFEEPVEESEELIEESEEPIEESEWPIEESVNIIEQSKSNIYESKDQFEEFKESLKESEKPEELIEEERLPPAESERIEDLHLEVPQPPMDSNVDEINPPALVVESDQEADVQPDPAWKDPNVVVDISYFSSKLKSHYRGIPKLLSYRYTAVLAAILAIVAAGFIVFGTEMPAKLRNLIMPGSQGNESATVLQNGSGNAAESLETRAVEGIGSSVPESDPGSQPDEAIVKDNGVQNRKTSPANRPKSQPAAEDKGRKKKESAARTQKEEEWNSKIMALFRNGNYNEAGIALDEWLEENPQSLRAKELNAKHDEIQRDLSVYALAMSQNRYEDALNALKTAEASNPSDPNFAALRRQIEAESRSARAMLSVRRLGGEATLFLDGQAVGANGEILNKSIPIGNHTISIESDGNLIATRSQKYVKGQQMTLVYDLAKSELRPMAEADLDSLAQRQKMEEVHSFNLDHKHGLFRGSCRGELLVNYYNLEYKPFSGQHGFQIPFKLLRISKIDGRSIEFSFNLDNKRFQSFEFHDDESADKFIRIWRELKAIPQ